MPLRELERMVDELAGWQARLPARSRYGIVGALRQTVGAAECWGYVRANPAKLMGPNPQPPPGPIRVYTLAELDAIVAEISPLSAAARLRRCDRAPSRGVVRA